MPKFHFFSFLQYLYEVLRRCAASDKFRILFTYLQIRKGQKFRSEQTSSLLRLKTEFARTKLQVYSD